MTQPISEAQMDAKEERVAEGLPVTKPPQTVTVGPVGNLLEQNPVLINAVVTLVVLIGTVYGTDLDPAQVGVIVGAVFTIGSVIVRQFVTPVARAEAGMEASFKSNPVTDARPVL